MHRISIVKEDVSLNKAIHLAFTTANFDTFVAMLDKMKIAYSDWPGTPNKVNVRADGMKQGLFPRPRWLSA
jgi:lactoylglutathione lyase